MAYEFYLGVDVPEDEPVTISMIEKETDVGANDQTPRYHVRRLQELDQKQEFDDTAAFLQNLMVEDPYAARTIVVVNRSNKRGLGVMEALEDRGLSPVGIVVTGGEASAEQEPSSGLPTSDASQGELVVTERELVVCLDDLYHDARLELPQENTEQVDLIAEGLQSYRVAVDDEGEGYVPDELGEKRAAAHSRHVYSAALACLIGEEHEFDPTRHLAGDLPSTGEAKRELRPDTEV